RFAQVLAVRLREGGGRDPVISIFDPTARGGALDDALRNPQPTRPVILLWDEIETAINHAEDDKEIRGDAVSLARNRPSLLHCLDRLEQTRHIVLVATTNQRPADLEPAYVREGRLTEHVCIS
ncbi:MAG: AAA family ATPase, partial [Myxococcota bacterium]|nr:AAA family ATPase [Myxococcota bacterium]